MRKSVVGLEGSFSWTLNEAAFTRLLRWLDGGTSSEGDSYLKTRSRLVSYFDRKNCLNPDELADETLNRVARRLEEESIVSEAPAKYCFTVARFVFLESLRSTHAREVPMDSAPPSRLNGSQSLAEIDEKHSRERMLECLEKCVGQLEADQRDLILGYYQGEKRAKIEHRQRIAAELGISVNALSIRACRIREKLEACVKRCARGD